MKLKTDPKERVHQCDEILSDPKIHGDEQRKFYDVYAKYWDEDVPAWFFNREKHVDEFLDFVRIDKAARILDVGCGTGSMGQLIKKKGFTNIDGIDSSSGMLEQARSKGIYVNYIHGLVRPEGVDGVKKDTYDALFGAAVLCSNHIDYNCFDSMISITKPGGYIYFLTSLIFLCDERNEFENKMREMQEQGKWRWILMKESPDKYYKSLSRGKNDDFDQTIIYAFQVI